MNAVTSTLNQPGDPAALLVVLGVLVTKRVLSVRMGLDPGHTGAGGALSGGALILTDGLLGFALGMVTAMRWTLWQRAKAVPPHQELKD